MNGFERRKQQKKNDILEGALKLFINVGFQKVSIAEIAEASNVSQVTIYNYFGSKEDLNQAVIHYYIEKLWDETEKVLNSTMAFPEKIEQIIFSKKKSANEMSERFYQELMKDYAEGNSYIEAFYAKKAMPKMMELLEEGKKEGYIDSSISNNSIMLYIQIFREQMQRKDIYSQILPITEDITKLFFYGLLGNEKNESNG